MASKFQNRLVGTVILVALVVIFLPDLMDGNKLEQKDEAFAWLEKAIEAGYASWRHMEEDEDLYNLRRDPRFDRAVEKARRAAKRAGDGEE